jgi:hypothetical protein
MAEQKEEGKISRREFLAAAGGLAAVAALGWGTAGYLAFNPPVRVVEKEKVIDVEPRRKKRAR